MKKIKKLLVTSIFVIIHAIGVALTLRAGVGVSSYDAFSQTLSNVFSIKVGTMGIIVNILFVSLQLILLRKIKPLAFIQIVMALILGYVINFFYYDILVFELSTYFTRMAIFLIANVIIGFGVAGIMATGLLVYPSEGFSFELCKKYDLDFTKVRFILDVIMVVISISLTLIFKTELSLREGTIISVLTYTPLLVFFQKKLEPILAKIGITEEN